MGIEEARKKWGCGKVNQVHPARRASPCHNGHDPVAFDYDQHILDRLFALPIDQLSRTDRNAVRGLTKGEHWHYETQPKRNKETAHQIVPPSRTHSLSEIAHFVAS